jgi:hypothetical protein
MRKANFGRLGNKSTKYQWKPQKIRLGAIEEPRAASIEAVAQEQTPQISVAALYTAIGLLIIVAAIIACSIL